MSNAPPYESAEREAVGQRNAEKGCINLFRKSNSSPMEEIKLHT
jgi:hypothetical protein